MGVNILGVKIDNNLTNFDVERKVIELQKTAKHSLIATVNPEFILDSQQNSEFRNIINNADLALPDGVGVLLAIKYLERTKNVNSSIKKLFIGLSLLFTVRSVSKARLTGRELVLNLCALAEQRGMSVGILGGWDRNILGKPKPESGDVAGKAAAELKKSYPGLDIIFASSEYRRGEADDAATLNYIHESMKQHNCSTIDILLVGYNHVWQEKWIERNADRIPAKVCVGIGGSLDYLAGTVYKVPKLFTNFGLEWLFRFCTQPYRLPRILKAFPIFPWAVFKQSLK